ncbi:MAG TPA: hypothetical protein PKW33_07700 [Anaerolineaceae bacterium]|nr:hypothetical protein [Anaerolineaceae bacterium]HPN51456.1 hypothetical protein [Anaerolineaceae bacterium]
MSDMPETDPIHAFRALLDQVPLDEDALLDALDELQSILAAQAEYMTVENCPFYDVNTDQLHRVDIMERLFPGEAVCCPFCGEEVFFL